MKIIDNEQMTMISGGSVHWHLRPNGSYSGGDDYLGSLPADANDYRWNQTTGKAIGASLGTLIGSLTGIPAGGLIGAILGSFGGR